MPARGNSAAGRQRAWSGNLWMGQRREVGGERQTPDGRGQGAEGGRRRDVMGIRFSKRTQMMAPAKTGKTGFLVEFREFQCPGVWSRQPVFTKRTQMMRLLWLPPARRPAWFDPARSDPIRVNPGDCDHVKPAADCNCTMAGVTASLSFGTGRSNGLESPIYFVVRGIGNGFCHWRFHGLHYAP